MIPRLLRLRLGRVVERLDVASALGLALLALVVITALLSPLAGYEPGLDVNVGARSLAPSLAHPLGTDHLGRDVLWRLLLACRAFMGPGALACAVAAALAVPAGGLAGFYGGPVGSVLRFGSTVVASVPRFVLVLLVATVYGNSLALLGVAAGVAYAPALLEDVHARVEELRTSEMVLASHAHGVPTWRLLWVHLVIGACGGIILRHLVLLFGFVVVLETTLSYIGGFGVPEPTPSWGNMLVFDWGYDGSVVSRLAPAVALWATVAATTAVGGLLGGRR